MRFRGSVLARADAAGYKGDCLQDAQGRVKKKKKINGGPGLKLRRSCGALTNWLPLGEGARNQGRRRHLGGILIRLTNRDACFRCRQQIFFFFFLYLPAASMFFAVFAVLACAIGNVITHKPVENEASGAAAPVVLI